MILEPIDYSEKLIQPGFNDFGTNICWDCEKACGQCPWTAIDPETKEVQFNPVPGWKTEKKRRKTGRNWVEVEQIVECPLFERTPDRRQK